MNSHSFFSAEFSKKIWQSSESCNNLNGWTKSLMKSWYAEKIETWPNQNFLALDSPQTCGNDCSDKFSCMHLLPICSLWTVLNLRDVRIWVKWQQSIWLIDLHKAPQVPHQKIPRCAFCLLIGIFCMTYHPTKLTLISFLKLYSH